MLKKINSWRDEKKISSRARARLSKVQQKPPVQVTVKNILFPRKWRAEALIASAFLAATLPPNGAGAEKQSSTTPAPGLNGVEKQITHSRTGHILTSTGVWSPDGDWLVYDTRSDPAGEVFDGNRIEMVNIHSGEVRVLYESRHAAHCGVATFNPRSAQVVFILGPENPTPEWEYGFYHRRGVIVDVHQPGRARALDARDLLPPFTPGALRGGSHVHVWDPAGQWVSFTYEDHVLARFTEETAQQEINLRNVGVSMPGHSVHVKPGHPRNHDADYFSVLVTRTKANPKPGSDEIKKAFEEGWVGTNGYVRPNGTQQLHALAFQGQVVSAGGQTLTEVFIADLPDDLTIPGDGPLAGTETRRPCPPRGTVQRRLTFTAARKYPGLQGPRHWLRSSPDGSKIAFLMKDDSGTAQLWTISPNGGAPSQLTRNLWPIASTLSWSPDGNYIAHVMDNSVCITSTVSGITKRLTPRSPDADAPRPEACVFSPDGKHIAFVRNLAMDGRRYNEIFVTRVED